MSRISKRNIILYSFLCLQLLFLGACSEKPDEEKINNILAEIQDAINSRHTGNTVKHLATDFHGEPHKGKIINHEEARRMVTALYFKYKKINVLFTGKSTKFSDSESDHNTPYRYATVTFRAFLSGGRRNILPETGQAYIVSTQWRKIDSDWEIISASAKKSWE